MFYKRRELMNEIKYNGYTIIAIPEQLIENNQWTVNIAIQKHHGEGTTGKPFSASNTFATKKEAIEHCLNFGKQIIDGDVINCTVHDL
jgi:hypothetical protein